MSLLLAFLSLSLLMLSTLLTEGSGRYFTIEKQQETAPVVITLNAQALKEAGLAQKFVWSFGNGETLTTTNSQVTYSYQTPGTYTVKLKYLSKMNDNLSKAKDGGSANVEVLPKLEASSVAINNLPPVADFFCSKAGIQKIHCESTSTDSEGSLSQFQWTLDDGSSYSTASFEHTFSRPEDVALANHSISLEVTNSAELKNTITKNIEVDLEEIRQAPRGYFKVFMNGTNVKLHSFIVKTQFPIKGAFYNVYGDGPTVLQRVDLSDFYANTQTQINLESYGNYRISLVVVDMRDQVVQISRNFSLVENIATLPPYVEARIVQSAARTAYINLNSSFDYGEYNFIRSFTVELGDGQIRELTNDETFLTYTYEDAGTYNIKITAKTNHNTQRTITREMTLTDDTVDVIFPDPTFSYQIYGYAQNVSFLNKKSGTPNGEILSYVWNFGDGSSGSGQTQAHFYNPGTYLVSLTVTDSAGLSSTQTQKITIQNTGANLVARLDCNQAPPFVDMIQKCKVTALDRLNDISRVRVFWGDGAVYTLGEANNPNQGVWWVNRKYTAGGSYPVKVVVETNRGEARAHEVNLNLTERPPVAYLQCFINGLMMYCDALSSYDPKGGNLTFSFDFGDGNTQVSEWGVVNHAYAEAGLYTIKVTVTDSTGLSGTSQTMVQALSPANIPPVAILNCGTPKPLTLGCNAEASSDPDGNIVSAKYEFDDGHTVTRDPNYFFEHQFETAGIHSVKLTVTDNRGAQTSIEREFNILPNQAPNVAINCSFDYSAYFLNCYSGVSDDSHITYKEWTINNDSFSLYNYGFSKSFHHVGENLIRFTVTDEFGATTIREATVIVNANSAPIIEAFCQSPAPNIVFCYNFSHDPEGHPYAVVWDIEGVEYPGHDIFVTLPSGGMKIVRVTATDLLGASRVVEVPIFIRENIPPIARMNCERVGEAELKCDAFDSSDSDGHIASYIWTIDGKHVFGNSIMYTFLSGGTKDVYLKVIDNEEGESSVFQTFNVNLPESNFYCDEIDTLVIKCWVAESSLNDKQSYRFVIDETYVEEGEEFEFEFNRFGQHRIKLITMDDRAEISITEKNLNFPSLYLGPAPKFDSFAVVGKKVSLNAVESYYQGRKVTEFAWEFDDGDIIRTTSPAIEHTFEAYGNQIVKLTVKDEQNVLSSLTKTIIVYNPEVADPGVGRNSSISGIDSDGDGIRDDIQRWIAFESRLHSNLKPFLKTMARSWEKDIVDFQNRSSVITEFEKRQKVGQCLLSQGFSKEDVSYYQDMMEYLYFDHESRALIYDKIKLGAGGGSIYSTSDAEINNQACMDI